MLKQHLYQVQILSKKTSHPLEAIAHYCGEDQYDVINSKQYSSNASDQVIWSNLVVPDKVNQFDLFTNLPEYLKFRSQKPDLISNARNILWKNVDIREKRFDSQFARLFELVVPHFLSQDEAINLVTCFAKVLTTEGMITDCSIHDHNKKQASISILEAFKIFAHSNSSVKEKEQEQDENDNHADYTAFIMCSLRDYKNGQFVNKNRFWNDKEKLKEWRTIWITFLSMAINNAKNVSNEDRDSWSKRLSIYPSPIIEPIPLKLKLSM
jgi:hypothetical protein